MLSVENMWWGLVLVGMTVAYGMALLGVQSARRHEVDTHRKYMIISFTLVGMWMVAYVIKQLVLGRDEFIGTTFQYWAIYVPILLVHTSLALATIGLGGANMVIGIRYLRHGSGVGAMIVGISRHRRLGRMLQWTFGGTILTAYSVYWMLFVWIPVS